MLSHCALSLCRWLQVVLADPILLLWRTCRDSTRCIAYALLAIYFGPKTGHPSSCCHSLTSKLKWPVMAGDTGYENEQSGLLKMLCLSSQLSCQKQPFSTPGKTLQVHGLWRWQHQWLSVGHCDDSQERQYCCCQLIVSFPRTVCLSWICILTPVLGHSLIPC